MGSLEIKQTTMPGGARYLDGTPMYPGPHVMTWLRLHPFMPWVLGDIRPIDDKPERTAS